MLEYSSKYFAEERNQPLTEVGVDRPRSDAQGHVTGRTQFYADRTLLKRPIVPADQAEAFFLLLSERLRQTTGQIITVDGGLHEAFLR